MKLQFKSAIFLSGLFLIPVLSHSNGTAQKIFDRNQFKNDTTITIDSATLFLDLKKCIHAIAFFNDDMFAAGCHNVYSITSDGLIKSFITLTDTSAKTRIWSMTFNDNGDLYIAANDRIIKITPTGKQTTVIKEDFPGPCGATDIKFDKSGNLYVAYGRTVAKYDSLLNKSIVINGKDFKPPIQWVVGIEFDDSENIMYIGDSFSQNLFIVPFHIRNYVEETKIVPTNLGQYLTKDNSGNIFLTMNKPDKYVEFLMVNNNSSKYYIYCKNRPFQDSKNYKKTIGFNNKAIYCIIGSKIYKYPLDMSNY